ncbi:MAG: hypothetical protein WCK32_01655 [Chlorobiaceae bacterium]
MSDLSKQAESAVDQLMRADENELYELLALRVKTIEQEPSQPDFFAITVPNGEGDRGIKGEIIELGKRIFQRWNAAAYQIVCGPESIDTEDRNKFVDAIGISETTMAAALSAMLVSSFGLAPAIAAVLAALVVKRFGRPVYEELCKTWKCHITE